MFEHDQERLARCQDPHARYAAFVDPAIGPINMAASPEPGAVLMALIRLHAPQVVVETGHARGPRPPTGWPGSPRAGSWSSTMPRREASSRSVRASAPSPAAPGAGSTIGPTTPATSTDAAPSCSSVPDRG